MNCTQKEITSMLKVVDKQKVIRNVIGTLIGACPMLFSLFYLLMILMKPNQLAMVIGTTLWLPVCFWALIASAVLIVVILCFSERKYNKQKENIYKCENKSEVWIATE